MTLPVTPCERCVRMSVPEPARGFALMGVAGQEYLFCGPCFLILMKHNGLAR